MMKYLIVNQVENSSNCCFCVYDEEGNFISQTYNFDEQFLNKDYIVVCYDIFEVFKILEFKIPFIYDTRILYGFRNNKSSSFLELARSILDESYLIKYVNITKQIEAYVKSFKITNFKVSEYSTRSLCPSYIVDELYREKSNLLIRLYNLLTPIDSYYKTYYDIVKSLYSINKNPLYTEKDGKVYLTTNPIGTRTGRLSFEKHSYNPYNVPKDARKNIVAPDGYSIVQIDYRSFQPRLAIYSTLDEDFKKKFYNTEDIYSVFPGDREKNKLSFLSWMFSRKTSEVFDESAFPIRQLKDSLNKTLRQDGKLVNSFGRSLYFDKEEDNVVFQHYVASLEVDFVLSIVKSISSGMKNKKSHIIFPFHDAIVFYVHESEMNLVPKIKSFMEVAFCSKFNTTFPVSVKVGKNFAEME